MQTRRAFLTQATVTLLLVPFAQLACTSGNGYGSSGNGSGCDGVSSTSTLVLGHTHSLCVAAAELANPPAAGVSLTTSSSAGHMHAVALSRADLESIAAGETVAVTTSSVDGHAHGFALVRAVQRPSPTPVY